MGPGSSPAACRSPAPTSSSSWAAASTTPGRPPARAATTSTPSSRSCATRTAARRRSTSTSYRKDGECVPMQYNEHKETVIPNISAPTAPETLKMQVWRTNHGIVQTRTTVNGEPSRSCIERSTYGREIASVLGFSRFNNPGFVKDATTFKQAAERHRLHVQLVLRRRPGHRLLLVRPATEAGRGHRHRHATLGRREVRLERAGCRSTSMPHEINPLDRATSRAGTTSPPATSRQRTTSGPTAQCTARRHSAVASPMPSGRARSAGPSSPGSSRTPRPRTYGPRNCCPSCSRCSATTPVPPRRASCCRRGWQDGAHRVDYDRDGSYAHQAAIRIFDTWWEDGDKSLAFDFVTPGLGADLARALPQPLDDHPREGGGSAWLGSPWYGYIDKELRSAGRRHRRRRTPTGSAAALIDLPHDLRASLLEPCSEP